MFSESVSENDKYYITLQLLEGFKKLFESKVAHGDLTTCKVLLNSNFQVFISDFAPIKPFNPPSGCNPIEFFQIWFQESSSDHETERCYLSPERLTPASDVNLIAADCFSLGCVISEIFLKGEAFLKFPDVLKMSKMSDAACADFIKSKSKALPEVISVLVQKLCARNPYEREIPLLDSLNQIINLKMIEKRNLLYHFKTTSNFTDLDKIEIVDRNDFENVLLMALTCTDLVTKAQLVKLIFQPEYSTELYKTFGLDCEICTVLLGLLAKTSDVPMSPLLKAFNILHSLQSTAPSNRDQLFRQAHKLVSTPDFLQLLNQFNQEFNSELIQKAFQMHRVNGPFESDVEEHLAFALIRNGIINFHSKSTLNSLSHCKKLLSVTQFNWRSSSSEYSSLPPPELSRIAFQLDLQRHAIPIETVLSRTVRSKPSKPRSKISSKIIPRLKQSCIATINRKINETCSQILQSPDRKYFIELCEDHLNLWDVQVMLLSAKSSREPFATVKPRSDSCIASIAFYNENLTIAFNDGKIGFYR